MELQKPCYNEVGKSQMLNIKVADQGEGRCLNPHHTPPQPLASTNVLSDYSR